MGPVTHQVTQPGFFPSRMTAVALDRIERMVVATTPSAGSRRGGPQGEPSPGSRVGRVAHVTGQAVAVDGGCPSSDGATLPIPGAGAGRAGPPFEHGGARGLPARAGRRPRDRPRVEHSRSGQSNPPKRVTTALAAAYVLRRKPPAPCCLRAAVDREYRCRRSRPTAVPVAKMVALCADDAVLAPLLLMEYSTAASCGPTLPGMTPADASRLTTTS